MFGQIVEFHSGIIVYSVENEPTVKDHITLCNVCRLASNPRKKEKMTKLLYSIVSNDVWNTVEWNFFKGNHSYNI